MSSRKKCKMKEFLEEFTSSRFNVLMAMAGFLNTLIFLIAHNANWLEYLALCLTFISTFSWGYQKCKSLNLKSGNSTVL